MTDLQYANRPLEKSFDAYLALREHLAKLNAYPSKVVGR